MTQTQSRLPMEEIARDLPTKSAKIRALAAAGYGRAEIAAHLGIRYQHVRNVLVADAAKSGAESKPSPSIATQLGPDGRVVIPADYRRALGLSEGGEVVMRVENDVLHLMSRDGAIRRVQDQIARFVPAEVDLVEELIAERRREEKKERRG